MEQEFDESEAIKFIQKRLTKVIDDDDILNVIDIIWDYYEDNGLLDISFSDSSDVDDENVLPKLVSHAKKMLQKDKYSTLTLDDVESIVLAEIEYEKSLDIL